MKYTLLQNDFSEEIDLIMPDREEIPLNINRQVYQQKDLFKITEYHKKIFSFGAFCKKECTWSCAKALHNIVPATKWMPMYDWRLNFLSDLIAGITTGIIMLPQAMAYAMLGNTPPVVGLYMAVFPVVLYFLFGTSRHNSIGTFAIICLMSGKIVAKHAVPETTPADFEQNKTLGMYPSTDVAATIAFTNSMFLLGMYALRLGIFANILSDVMVNGFTSGAACHVICSQIPNLLGLNIIVDRGYFSIPKNIIIFIRALPEANRMTISISFFAVMIMVINNEALKPWLSKYTKIPVPIELIVVILGTMASYFWDLSETDDVFIVKNIPIGLPYPRLPVFSLIPEIILDCFLITIVSYSVSISMASLFAQKAQYKIKPNQELLAMGMSNLVGSFFSCLPICASLARTYIQYTSGGRTQISSIIATIFILVILLFMGPLFEPLPRCILASVVVVALKGLLQQIRQFPSFAKLDGCDAAIWTCTFFPTVLISIDIGLLSGVGTSLAVLFLRGHRPYTCVLAQVPNTELYLDIERHKGLEEVDGIKIFQFCGSLNFALKGHFKRIVYESAMLNPSNILRYILNPITEDDHDHIIRELVQLRCLIIEFSGLVYIDPSCIEVLETLIIQYAECGVATYISGCSTWIYEKFKAYEKHKGHKLPLVTFSTVHDAMLYAKKHAFLPRSYSVVMKEMRKG